MNSNRALLNQLYRSLQPSVGEMVDRAVNRIVEVKNRQGKVVAVTGSGPNLHEGVTTLIAELIHKGVVDGVTTVQPLLRMKWQGH